MRGIREEIRNRLPRPRFDQAGGGSTITVEHPDHGELEVELPEGFISEEQINDNYVPKGHHNAEMAKLRREAKGLVSPDDVLEDEEFRERALGAWGIDPEGQGDAPRLTEERVQAIREEAVRKRVKPLEEERDNLRTEVEGLRRQQLTSAILTAASGVVKEGLLKSPTKGAAPPIVNMLAPYFDYDPETGQWAVREGDGFRYSGEPSETEPYMGPEEFLASWADDEANADWVRDTRQRGPGAKDDRETGGGGGVVTISHSDAQDNSKYKAAKAKAEERGVELRIVDQPWSGS